MLVKFSTVLASWVLSNATTVSNLGTLSKLGLHDLLNQRKSIVPTTIVTAVVSLLSEISVDFLVCTEHV